jgi:hypothetical protein
VIGFGVIMLILIMLIIKNFMARRRWIINNNI